jgi:tRNA pseudouridine55 synthase
MFGLLNIDKLAGITSRDVVNRVQRLVKPHKVGHAGTLDPLATGILVVAVGPATRLVEYVQRMPKTYHGTFLLGRTSDTEDIEGQVVELPGTPVPTFDQLAAAVPQFLGTIQQQPPAYSALKVAGQRAYALARRGEAVELAERPVHIHELKIVRYEYPELELLIRCGSGTYIRSLGRDLARAVGTDAVMSALRRMAIGPLKAADAIVCDQLTVELINERLLSPALAVADLPVATVNEAECRKLVQGQAIADRWTIAGEEAAAIDECGELVAILARHDRRGLRPAKGFLQDR